MHCEIYFSTLKAGTTTITATATDGSGIVGSTTFTVNKDSSVKIFVVSDVYGTTTNKLKSYFTNVTENTGLTASQIIAGNYDVIIDDAAYTYSDYNLINQF